MGYSVHNIRHLALLLCSMNVTDKCTDDQVQLYSVVIRWVRQEVLLGVIKGRKMGGGGITFVPNFVDRCFENNVQSIWM